MKYRRRLRFRGSCLLLLSILLEKCLLHAFTSPSVPCSCVRGKKVTPRSNFEKLRAERVPIEEDTAISSSTIATIDRDDKSFKENAFVLSIASIIGISAGLNIAVFKTLIELLSEIIYGGQVFDGLTIPPVLQPAIGGIFVGLLVWRYGKFAPGLRGTIREVDKGALLKVKLDMVNARENGGPTIVERPHSYTTELGRASRKTLGSVFTLGAGNSLGPEGPSVELGMAVSRLVSMVKPPEKFFGVCIDDEASAVTRNRLFLSCGAAAGVAAGFNAPLAGVFFALEIVQAAFRPVEQVVGSPETKFGPMSTLNSNVSIKISPILLSSVISALLAKNLLGNELALSVPPFDFQNPLLELPLYLLLGVLSGVAASLFSGAAQISKAVFDGTGGPSQLQGFFYALPAAYKPLLGSLFCGCVGVFVPETLFFGYDTLNRLLAEQQFPTDEALLLLLAKFSTTTVAAASGLVGGTFAPSLFIGGMIGASYHNLMLYLWTTLQATISFNPLEFDLSGTPAYALVGGASVLASLFRAPLTATMLLFECTRNYDVILPLMASAGVASLVGDVVEKFLEEQKRDEDSVSWGDLAMTGAAEAEK